MVTEWTLPIQVQAYSPPSEQPTSQLNSSQVDCQVPSTGDDTLPIGTEEGGPRPISMGAPCNVLTSPRQGEEGLVHCSEEEGKETIGVPVRGRKVEDRV